MNSSFANRFLFFLLVRQISWYSDKVLQTCTLTWHVRINLNIVICQMLKASFFTNVGKTPQRRQHSGLCFDDRQDYYIAAHEAHENWRVVTRHTKSFLTHHHHAVILFPLNFAWWEIALYFQEKYGVFGNIYNNLMWYSLKIYVHV